MSDQTHADGPREEADRVFEAGSDPHDAEASLARMDEAGRTEFLSRLAVRAALRDREGDEGAIDDLGLLDGFERAYAAAKARSTGVEGFKDLSKPAPWVAAMDAFNGDDEFVMKLCGRHVSQPPARFVRYVADALGVGVGQVRQHFAPGGHAPGIAGAENKASGKLGKGRVEDFAEAVQAADIPEELRARWLAE